MKKLIPIMLLIEALVVSDAIAQSSKKNSSLKAPSGVKAEEINQYWTEEKIRNAKPIEPPLITEEEYKKLIKRGIPSTKERPRVVEPSHDTASKPNSEQTTPKAIGQVQRADVSTWPFNTGGKLFFTKASGGDFVCSAQYVGSKRVIMTAAHCVIDGASGAWHKNFIFRQGYTNGGGRSVGWECMSVKTAWHQSGPNYPFDYAFIYASSDSENYLGIKTLIPYNQFWDIGYPGNFENGQYMQKVEGVKGVVSGGTVAMNNNPFGGGSSGGSWIGDLATGSSGSNNYAIGLNSFYRGSPNPIYSPYFNSTTFGLWESVRDKKCMKN